MEIVLANVAGKTRREFKDGREYLVAPAVLIVSNSVLNGSAGALYYPSEEVGKSPSIWDKIPIVINHPVKDGSPISVNDPDILEKTGIGMTLNSSYDGRLKTEMWLDVERTKKVSPKVWNDISKGKQVELSTGLFSDNELVENGKDGKGRPYQYVARNYRPDHVAILPDSIGACSVKDGCGLLVNKAVNEIPTSSTDDVRGHFFKTLMDYLFLSGNKPPVVNQPSHSDIRSSLTQQLREQYPGEENEYGYVNYPVYICDVFDKYIVYDYEGKLYKLPYSSDLRNNKVTLSTDSPVEVTRVTTYKNVQNSDQTTSLVPDGEEYMSVKLQADQKKSIVDALVANCVCDKRDMPWKGKDAATLNALSDDTLLAWEETRKALTTEAPKPVVPSQPTPGAPIFNVTNNRWEIHSEAPYPPAQPVQPAPVPAVPAVKPSVPVVGNEAISLPDGTKVTADQVRNEWSYVQEMIQRKKSDLIEQLTANVEGDHKATAVSIYAPMDIRQLELLANAMPKPAQQQQTQPIGSFFGSAGAAPHQPALVEEPLPGPVHNWGKSVN